MEISITEFKSKCLRLMEEVHRTGEELEITKHGRKLARVVPYVESKPWKQLLGTGYYAGEPEEIVVKESEIDGLL